MKKFIVMSAILSISVVAQAGTVVWGYGNSIGEACHDAERQAQKLVDQWGTCAPGCDSAQCQQTPDGGWRCPIDVANHHGSCGDFGGR